VGNDFVLLVVVSQNQQRIAKMLTHGVDSLL
jgi:hypothetical protein